MKVYTGTSWTKANQEECARLGIGMMPTPVDPVHPDTILKEVDVAFDNGAFFWHREKKKFQEKVFYNWLNGIDREPDFVAVPDIVCGGMMSREFSLLHIDRIPFKKYFVVQDGMTFESVGNTISKCDGCFIGGSTTVGKCAGWKWQVAPREFIKPCHEIGLPVHMGRCPGNVAGLYAADRIGIDSIDSSTLIRHQKLGRIEKLNLHLIEQRQLE
jgi:hypothetical protein